MTSTWIDFKELRSKLRFADVLKHYGLTLKVKGDRATGFCPLPGHPKHDGKRHSPSFSANLARGIFQCFGCGLKGNCLDFIARMEGLNPDDGQDLRRAALLAIERLGLASSADSKSQPPARPKNNAAPPERSAPPPAIPKAAAGPVIINAPLDFELRKLDPAHPYLKERGFTPETIAHFGLGFCSRGMLQGRIAIPLHDATGCLIGYAGRLVDDSSVSEHKPKYLFPGSRERDGKTFEFHKSLFLYNGFAVGKVKNLIIVEGFASVWWLWQHGRPNTAALMGWSCSEEQARLIVNAVEPNGCVWAMPDGDEAGKRCAETVLKLVSPHRSIRWAKLAGGEQPTDMKADELAVCLP
jgi:DNA primase